MHRTVSFSHFSTAVFLGVWLCTQLTSPAVAQDRVRAKVRYPGTLRRADGASQGHRDGQSGRFPARLCGPRRRCLCLRRP